MARSIQAAIQDGRFVSLDEAMTEAALLLLKTIGHDPASAAPSTEVLPFDLPAADLAGQIAGDLDKVGRPFGRCDPMTAAIAITHGLDLMTGNTSHYRRMLTLGYVLSLVNWRI